MLEPSAAPNRNPGAEHLFFASAKESSPEPLNIICIGAHPDDPETGCGGTLAKFANQGHHVTILYLTRGEAGIRNGESRTTATIRSAEARKACRLLRADAAFANQIDGQTAADPSHCATFSQILLSLRPDIVFTHWPIDTHHDHRTAAALAYQAWQAAGEAFTLVYYEVMTGVQTHHFYPNHYVDIGPFCDLKRSAIYAHASQAPDRFYSYHEEMERRRGSEARTLRAEAFMVMREKWPKPFLAFSL
ncbi:MAG: PIG-L family deacetylase [Acidobacteriaceae bacterium]|nr:PIG-L family deacetylase [Acidobacteriaceae bacterium]